MSIDRSSPEYLAKRRARYQLNKIPILKKLSDSHRLNPVVSMLRDAKKRVLSKGLDFSITKEDIIFPDICPISLLKLKVGYRKLTPNSPTLDRIDNTKGYIKGNIAVISNRANAMKRDASTKEIQRLLEYMQNAICS